MSDSHTGVFQKELETAFGALTQASKLSQLIISSHDKGTITKDDLSPVTIADFAIQALLIAAFKHVFPDDTFVGEEDAADLRANETLLSRVWDLLNTVLQDEDTPEGARKLLQTTDQMCDLIDQAGTSHPGGPGSGRVWVFDPIDGTKTYLRGELYAINIGLIVDGKQTLGVVACPNLSLKHQGVLHNGNVTPDGGCIVYAIKGHGAVARPLRSTAKGTEAELVKLAPTSAAQDLKFVTCTGLVDSALDGVHEVVAERLGLSFPGSDLVPWVLRWAAMALGIGNVTVWVYKRRDRYAKAWDHAGAMLLFEETGGKITDVHGKDIDLSAGRKLSANFGFVAAPVEQHAKVLSAVQDVLREQGRDGFLQ
ncbi:aminopeptidase [Trichoderma arundinaceum]|uniref:Aminopeptidase n=1 Tax=Trichoderma arundinaceum TaxID=490622 RepID=A0A395NZI7_TRIAR|nr:aminopeptidase [Trichoderma arundinaceum]